MNAARQKDSKPARKNITKPESPRRILERLKNMVNPYPINQAVEDFLFARTSERYSLNTISSYRNALTKFCNFVGQDKSVRDIGPLDIRGFFVEQDEVTNITLVKYHTAISALWTYLVEQKEVNEHIAQQVKPPEPEEREILPFSPDEIVRLLLCTDRSKPYKRGMQRMCDHATHAGARDRAVIYILLDTGIRVSELTGLRVGDLEEGGFTVMGKGRKERWVPMSETTHEYLWIYLESRKEELKKDTVVFPIERRSIDHMLTRLEKRSGVKGVHAHRFRHTFAITYLRNGGDPYTLQKILGHSSLEMVKKYLAIARVDIQAAHARCSPVASMKL